MIMLKYWAERWQIPEPAMQELRLLMGEDPSQSAVPPTDSSTLEGSVSKRVRYLFAQAGALLWRNNVGALRDDDGRFVRYGLANDSQAMNKNVKSSDLIGLQPVQITPDMVGQIIGQFVAIETKRPGWRFTGTDREVAQQKFLHLVISKGGIGRFSTGE